MSNSAIKLVSQTLLLAIVILLLPLVAAAQGKIAFSSNRDGNYEIYLMNADGSNLINLTHTPGQNERDPSISPDGSKIAFTRVPIGNPATYLDPDIYVMNVDGSHQINLTNYLARDEYPAFSPDGSKIAFKSNRDDGFDRIWVMNADGSNPTVLTSGPEDFEPSFSPDGSKIAFLCYSNSNNWDICLINADGSNQIDLTNDSALDGFPTFSPDGSKIAFESYRTGNQDIYSMNVDGSNLVNVSNDFRSNDRKPAFSPDGAKISFTSARDGNEEIYVMNSDGSNQTRLTNNPAVDFGPSWGVGSVAPGKIVFTSFRDGADSEIYVMNANGSNPTQLTDNSTGDTTPTLSPDGSKIAFISSRDGNNFELYVMNTDGSNQTRLTFNSTFDGYPSFSPDGSKIVFASGFGNLMEIYEINVDGSNLTRLTNNHVADFEPSFKPDGSQIVFESGPADGSNYEIYLMNADGSNQINLSNNPASEDAPVFSPDGNTIAFGSNRSGNFEIYVMNPDGSNQTNLTNHAGNDLEPTYSPDGSKIGFYSDRDGNGEIYVMNVDGSNQVNVTNNSATDVFPSWGVGSNGDYTPPTITPTVSGNLGNDGWYVSDVQVTWSVTDGESAISNSSGCDAQSVSTDTSGITFTCTATSEGGTSSQTITIKRDATPPTLNPTVTPNSVFLNGTATATPNASDNLSGVASQSCLAVDTSIVGSHSVVCTASDNAGNTANANANYQVVYNFTGFFQPVDNLPTVNNAPAGKGIAVKFSLAGNQGLAIFAAGYPASSLIPCDVSDPGSDLEETVNAGGSSLSFDATTNQYSYIWKTDKAWKGTCRMLVVRFNDGTEHLAKFKFK